MIRKILDLHSIIKLATSYVAGIVKCQRQKLWNFLKIMTWSFVLGDIVGACNFAWLQHDSIGSFAICLDLHSVTNLIFIVVCGATLQE